MTDKTVSKNLASKAVFLFIGLFFIASVLSIEVDIARYKPFWQDEGLEMIVTCPLPYKDLILKGAYTQCNPFPFYYLVQKPLVNHLFTFNESIQLQYRYVSLIASALLLLFIFLFYSMRLHSIWGILGLLGLVSAPLYQIYSAENRPYMFWILFYCISNFSAVLIVTSSSDKWKYTKLAIFFISSILLTLTVSPGFIQLSAIVFWWLLYLWIVKAEGIFHVPLYPTEFYSERKKIHSAFGVLAILLTVCGFLFMNYVFNGPKGNVCSIVGGEFDLLATMQKGDFHLLKGVLRLLWPKGSAFIMILNCLFLIGSISIVFLWKKRFYWNDQIKFIFALNSLMWVQLLLTCVISILIAYKHYLFVQRMFIYLFIPRSVFIATGAHFLISGSLKDFSTNLRLDRILKVAAPVLIFIFMSQSLDTPKNELKIKKEEFSNLYTNQSECPDFKGDIEIYVATQLGNDVPHPNYIVYLDREIKRCGWKNTGTKSYAWVTSNGLNIKWLGLKDEPPEGIPLTQCNRTPVLRGDK